VSIDSIPKRSKPLPRTQRTNFNGNLKFSSIPSKTNRSEQIRRSDDTFKNISIGLQDIDEAILFFFNNVIKPQVTDNGVLIDVPVQYGDREMWDSVQKQGFVRDQKGKIITPLIMYRRINVSKDQSVPIDKTNGNIVHFFPQKWSQKNKYDRFSRLNNRKPTYELYNVVVPDYIILNYECVIWTSFISQMNKIIESIQYWEGHYWGDEKKFQFKSKIDSFDQNVELDTERGRIVKSNFTIESNGFLIPEIANDLITTQKQFSRQEILIDTETDIDVSSLLNKDQPNKKIIVNTTSKSSANQSVSQLINETLSVLKLEIQYLRKKFVYSSLTTIGTTVEDDGFGNSVITYPNVYTASLPVGSTLSNTEKYDFLIFINGQYVEHDTYNIYQNQSNFIISISTGSLGYTVTDTDEIISWGLFNS